MEVYKNTIIYIFTPANTWGGGTNSCHQLCYKLRLLKYNAFILYYDIGLGVGGSTHPNATHYNNPVAFEFHDYAENIAIIPESATPLFTICRNVRKAVWWLGVDLYYSTLLNHSNSTQPEDYFFFDILAPSDEYHFTDSIHAKKHLEAFNIPKYRIMMLESYINPVLVKNVMTQPKIKKENLVTFDPRRNLAFTKRIISCCDATGFNNVKFIPLINLSIEKLSMIYKISKVHINFGEFSGREYIPRESSINDCCIITGKMGAAKYYGDVPIPDKYKFEADEGSLPQITKCIKTCLDEYCECIKDFMEYKKFSLGLERTFMKQIREIFIRV